MRRWWEKTVSRLRPDAGAPWRDYLQRHSADVVRDAYRSVLRRDADPAGLDHWVRFLNEKGSVDAFMRAMVRSPEYRARVGEEVDFLEALTGPAIGDSPYVVLGNCQAGMVARCIQALTGGSMPAHRLLSMEALRRAEEGVDDLGDFFEGREKVFIQPLIWSALKKRYGRYEDRVALFPSLSFMAYHPDLIAVRFRETQQVFFGGPGGFCNSSIIFLASRVGLSLQETEQLFSRRTFERLGFFGWWPGATQAMVEEGRRAKLDLEGRIASWHARSAFMYCHFHPKLFAIADITRALLRREGIGMVGGDPIQYVHDRLANGSVWPVYPEIASELGCEGSYLFKGGADYFAADTPLQVYELRPFIEKSMAAFALQPEGVLDDPCLHKPAFLALSDELRQRRLTVPVANGSGAGAGAAETAAAPGNPYKGLPASRFWRDAVAGVAPSMVDPVIDATLSIDAATRVATAGSCFAQHIARRLRESRFHFLVTEPEPAHDRIEGLAPDPFSARYGNVYTARQLRQLLERAYGDFDPVEPAWRMHGGDGRVADPFRPTIEPKGFASIAAMKASRASHLVAVRRLFETLDVFVFTLGLTEAWRSGEDGAVFPLAPGVVAGRMDPQRHEFVNFRVDQVVQDLESFLRRLVAVNAAARVLFTVSPVPLAATYEPRHVLVSTSSSKAVLRAAVEEVVRRNPCAAYFPSYEIITGPQGRGAYFADDLRTVTPAGVDHVMRVFFEHYTRQHAANDAPRIPVDVLEESRRALRVICDEDLLATR